ncbi:hypothetical protein [Nonomuraea aurantiaca]|uniref:hypothetical protein n=1 Tax=Nonomuraea aurantiaca TaxID=2878562 RepID=UPI001CDA305B|nr:hypothetical protein [Nonomuraea aurantiaca]MCA2220562.1 hypothetical protein [Nonomuraea aurantiaca]
MMRPGQNGQPPMTPPNGQGKNGQYAQDGQVQNGQYGRAQNGQDVQGLEYTRFIQQADDGLHLIRPLVNALSVQRT